MIRTLVAVTTIVGVTTVVLAQSDAVATRKELMGTIANHAWSAFPKMVKGQEPYDQTKVDTGFVQMTDAAQKLPAQFPEGTQGATRPGSNYLASPKIWENKADFDARLAKLSKDIAAAKPKVTSLDGLKDALPNLLKNCDSCHDAYRVRK
ncbi:MAG: cytochrome c [Xanthobacteraceae bacterium]